MLNSKLPVLYNRSICCTIYRESIIESLLIVGFVRMLLCSPCKGCKHIHSFHAMLIPECPILIRSTVYLLGNIRATSTGLAHFNCHRRLVTNFIVSKESVSFSRSVHISSAVSLRFTWSDCAYIVIWYADWYAYTFVSRTYMYCVNQNLFKAVLWKGHLT